MVGADLDQVDEPVQRPRPELVVEVDPAHEPEREGDGVAPREHEAAPGWQRRRRPAREIGKGEVAGEAREEGDRSAGRQAAPTLLQDGDAEEQEQRERKEAKHVSRGWHD